MWTRWWKPRPSSSSLEKRRGRNKSKGCGAEPAKLETLGWE
jgi:hypothetical protein